MTTETGKDDRPGLFTESTPAQGAVAAAFFAFVAYFVAEHYFMATEYFAETPPYLAIAIVAAAGAGLVFGVLRRVEPGASNHAVISVLTGLAVGLAIYAFIPRLNLLTDVDGLHAYTYELDADLVWQPRDAALPPLRLYLERSQWWQQYKPGDTYEFDLRRGGLGIWQVNMARTYAQQKRFYDCKGVMNCEPKKPG